jgi:hypothetical protein
MKKALEAAVLAGLLGAATAAHATPSTTYWTSATTYVQPFLVPHITYDTYVAERGLLQNTYGLTVGFLPFPKLQGEVGVDLLLPGGPQLISGISNPNLVSGAPAPTGTGSTVGDNVFLNAKLGIPEGAFAGWQPGVSAGIQSVGFAKDYSDFNHLHAEIGKTFAPVGTFTVGGYYGLNDKLYVSSSGSKEQGGFTAAYMSPDINVGLPGLTKVVIAGDYASGNNVFGAYGAGVYFYFTPAIDLLTGPVFFNDKELFKRTYGTDWMWTFQLDVDIEFRKPAK